MSETPIDARLGQYAEMEMELEEWGTDFNPPKPSIKQKSSNPTSTKTSTALHENKFQYATDGLNLHHNSDVGEISGAMPSSKVHLDQQSDVKPKRTKLENDLSKRESLDSQIWMEKGEAMPLEEDDGLSIKFSLSQDEDVYVTGDKDDALFTDYFMRNSPKESFDDNRFLPPTDTFPNQGALLPSPLQLQGDEHFDFPDSINSPAAASGIPLPKLQTHSSPTSPPRNPTFATGHAPSSPLDCHNQQQMSDNDDLGGSKLESPPAIKNEYRNDKPSNKNEASWKSSNLSTPPRFPVELTDHEHEVHISPYTIEFAPNTGPRQHTSPGRTIYNVPSKSPSHLTSHKDSPPSPYEPHPWPPPPSRSNHSTPSSVHHQRNSETPPRYARGAQRGDARLRNHGATPAVTRGSGPNKEVTPHHHHRTSHPRMTGNGSSDLIVTPYPSELRSAVSAESTSPLMLHQPDHSRNMHSPPARHPHHHTPSHHPQSVCGGSAGSHGTPYPPPTYSNSDPKWSESLHLAPLPPFVAHQRGGVHPPSWSHHPSVPPGSHAYPPAPPGQNPGWNTGAHGHPYYSPYYHQHMLPPSEHASNHTPSQCHQPHRSMSNTSRPTSSNSGTPTAQHATESLHWRQKYHQLHLFKKQFGHCNVPPGYGAGTEWKGLYNWVMDQRYQHQRLTRGEPSTMTPARGRMLSSLGFTWDQSVDYGHGSQGVTPNHVSSSSKNNSNNNNKSYSSWDKWMSLLAEYRAKHGNVDVPLKYEPNPSLGTFVNRQRTEHRKMQAGKPCSMTKERVHDLNRLGFTWAIRESHTSWEDRFAELKEFNEQNGHCNVPKIYTHNPSLGYWVNEQRFQYRRLMKKKPSYMTQDKIKALNSLDFKWSLRETNGSWETWMKELKSYAKIHGDVDVPLKYAPNQALGAFVNRQRTEYRKMQQGVQTSLTEERIQDLNTLGFKWAIRVSRTPWEQRLKELKIFKAEYGHCNVPSTFPKNQPLAYWVFKQRGQYRIYLKGDFSQDGDGKQSCHMTPERINALDNVGFEWNPPRRIK